MAISYPITLPTSPAPRSFTEKPVNSVGVTRSPWTLKTQMQMNQGQLWIFSLDLPPMSDAQARAWSGALSSLNGRFGTFLFGDPRWKTPVGTWAGSPVVDGAGQAGQTLALRGFTAAATGKAGDYFQLGADSNARLHRVTQDFTADGSGLASVEIWPRLRSAPFDAGDVVTATPQGVFRLVDDVPRSFEPFRHGIAFDVEEDP